MKKLVLLTILSLMCLSQVAWAQISPANINNYSLSIQPAVVSSDTLLNGTTFSYDSTAHQFVITQGSQIEYRADSLEVSALVIADSAIERFSIDWYRSPSDTSYQTSTVNYDSTFTDSTGSWSHTQYTANSTAWMSSSALASDTLIAGVHKKYAVLTREIPFLPVRVSVRAAYGALIGWGYAHEVIASDNIDAKKYLVIKKK